MQKPESIKSKHEEWWSAKVDNEGRRILDGVFFHANKGHKDKIKTRKQDGCDLWSVWLDKKRYM